MKLRRAVLDRLTALLRGDGPDPVALLQRLAAAREATSSGDPAVGPTPRAAEEARAVRAVADLLAALRDEMDHALGPVAAPKKSARAGAAAPAPAAAHTEPPATSPAAGPRPPDSTPLWTSDDPIRSAKVYVDGCSKGNPGPSAGGVVVVTPTDEPLHEAGVAFGRMTNNEAEYRTLLAALQILAARGVENVFVFSDSELMVKQLTGVYRIKKPELAALAAEAQRLRRAFRQCRFTAVPREKNERADELANWAIAHARPGA